MERSHIPLHKWLLAIHLLCSSKKGYSAHQLMRTLGLGSYRTAWFMAHRIREPCAQTDLTPMGGKRQNRRNRRNHHRQSRGRSPEIRKGQVALRNVVMTLVERGGIARSFHVDGCTIGALKPIIRANIARETAMMTDQASWYPEIGREFASHDSVNHGKEEYVA